MTLLTYDLFIQKHEAITTSIAKAFKPKWVNHYTIEYENPKGQGRVTKKLAEPLVKLVVGPTGIPADTHILLVKKDGSLLYRKGNRKSLYSLEGEFDTIDISKEIKLNAWQIRGLHYLFDNNKFSEIKKDQEGYVTDAWVAKITFADKIGSHSVTFFPWGEKEGSSLAKIFEYLLKLSPEKISLYGFS